MKHVALALAFFLLLSSHAKPPGYTPFGYEVLQASPAVFDDVLGVRDLYQADMVVRVDPMIHPPNYVQVTTRGGLNVSLPVTSYGPLGGNCWLISTAHVPALGLDGPARLVAASTVHDATYRGALVQFR